MGETTQLEHWNKRLQIIASTSERFHLLLHIYILSDNLFLQYQCVFSAKEHCQTICLRKWWYDNYNCAEIMCFKNCLSS